MTVPPEQEDLGVLPVQTAFVPESRHLLGRERETGRDSKAEARHAHRRLGAWANRPAADPPAREVAEWV